MVGSTLSGLGGREHEHHVRRRLLDRLQQRVRRRRREHVHLVEEVHLALRGRAEPEVDPRHEVASSSTPRFDAASISMRSENVPAAIDTQFSHLPHGSPSAPSSRQFSALARMRAVVVLPFPRGAGEEVRVPDATVADGVAECGGDVVLADELTEPLRSVLPVERLERHRSDPSGACAVVRPWARGPGWRRRRAPSAAPPGGARGGR